MKLAVVAGEASGDLHASEVVRELKHFDPSLETFGIGGDLLAMQGTKILHHAREMGIVGLFNVLRHLGMFKRIFRELIDRIVAERPDAVLLVDYPDFNLRVARRVKELGIPVIYYISPQVWAWRRGRVRHIAEYVDRMIVIFPFEEEFYKGHRVPVTYVGHPLIEQLQGVKRPAGSGRIRVALLPGSRRGEVDDLLPAMLEAVRLLKGERPSRPQSPITAGGTPALRDLEAFIVQAPTIDREQLERVMKQTGIEVPIVLHDGGEAVASANVALSSSGTATLEAAIIGTPVVVMYKLTPATYLIARRLVRLPHFSLVNIVAGKGVVPELLQHHVTGPRIADEVRRLLEPETRRRVVEDLAAVKAKLGEPGASRRAAEAIMNTLKR